MTSHLSNTENCKSLNSGTVAASHNFPLYLLSDVGDPRVSKTFDSALRAVLLFGIAKRQNFTGAPDWIEVRTRLGVDGPNQRIFVKVVSRRPKAYRPHDHVPDYLLAYVTETFDCGHSQDFHFIDDLEPLVARKRVCHECSGFAGALPLLPEKKPSASVPSPELPEKKEAA